MSTLAAMGCLEEQAASKVSPFDGLARPDEVGQAAVWMVSDSAACMNEATTVPFDVGMSVM